MKVAIVHDWLVRNGGPERVLSELLDMFPRADLFTAICSLPPADLDLVRGRAVQTSFIQKLPFPGRWHRRYIPLLPIAVERFDLSAYGLVISSSLYAAKGVITGEGQLHVCYQHGSAWCDLAMPRRRWGLASIVAATLRAWDFEASYRPDRFIASSSLVARRLRATYGLPATVIHPPVDASRYRPAGDKDSFYLAVADQGSQTGLATILAAFTNMPDKRLFVIGDAAEHPPRTTPNITFLGRDREYVACLQKARALVSTAEEPATSCIEAQACGTPVIAPERGSALEMIIGSGRYRTGLFYAGDSVADLQAAVSRFEQIDRSITVDACRRNAMRFASERFRENILAEINAALRGAGGGQPELADRRLH